MNIYQSWLMGAAVILGLISNSQRHRGSPGSVTKHRPSEISHGSTHTRRHTGCLVVTGCIFGSDSLTTQAGSTSRPAARPSQPPQQWAAKAGITHTRGADITTTTATLQWWGMVQPGGLASGAHANCGGAHSMAHGSWSTVASNVSPTCTSMASPPAPATQPARPIRHRLQLPPTVSDNDNCWHANLTYTQSIWQGTAQTQQPWSPSTQTSQRLLRAG